MTGIRGLLVMSLVFSPRVRARSRLSAASHSRQKVVRSFLGGVVFRENPKKCTYLMPDMAQEGAR